MKLCWKCCEYLKKKYGSNFYMIPSTHCHHDEPEEKPREKCWCEKPLGYQRLQLHDYIVDQWGLGHYQMRPVENAKFCPRCSRFLGDIK